MSKKEFVLQGMDIAEPLMVYVDDDVIVDGRFAGKYLDKDNQVHIGEIITT